MKYKTASGVIIEADDTVVERVADTAHVAAIASRDARWQRRTKLALTTRMSRRPWFSFRNSREHAMYARARAVSKHLERWARVLEVN